MPFPTVTRASGFPAPPHRHGQEHSAGRASGFSLVPCRCERYDISFSCSQAARDACTRLEGFRSARAEEAIDISTMSEATAVKRPIGQTIKAYVALTKPRVLELLLVSTVPVMFLAEGGMPNLWLVVATVIGGSMSAGSAASFNMYLDRDMDAHMHRTVNRPLVTGEITPRGALIFSWVLAV